MFRVSAAVLLIVLGTPGFAFGQADQVESVAAEPVETADTADTVEVPADAPPASAAEPMPYTFDKPLTFVVTRSETLESKLKGADVRYLRRGPGEATLHVQVAPKDDDPNTLELRLPRLDCTTRFEAGVLNLKAGPARMRITADEKPVRVLSAEGSDEERRQLAFVTQAPWYRLNWDGSGWARARNVAQGEAWPLADRYALARELLLLLPVRPEKMRDRESFERVIVTPYPLPLNPALTSLATYKLARRYEQNGQKLVEYTFLGRVDHTPSGGFSWGGIRLKGARATGELSGSVTFNAITKRLSGGSFNWVLEVRNGGPDHFLSTWKGKSQWTRNE